MFEYARTELFTLRDCLRFAVSRFTEAGLAFGHGNLNAWDEAVYLAQYSLKLPLNSLEPFLDARLLLREKTALLDLYERRVRERLPAAYLTHEAWLAGHAFYVDKRVIVPRSFIAELLEEELMPWVRKPEEVRHCLDLCTGSGCLAILTAHAFPNAHIDAVDISADALAVARHNVKNYNLTDQITLIESDGFAALTDQKYDIIISNPPYVDGEAMKSLPREYQYEPVLALASGEDGLDFTRQLLKSAKSHLNPGGLMVVEIGHNRTALETAFPELPFTWLETTAGNQYVFMLRQEDLQV